MRSSVKAVLHWKWALHCTDSSITSSTGNNWSKNDIHKRKNIRRNMKTISTLTEKVDAVQNLAHLAAGTRKSSTAPRIILSELAFRVSNRIRQDPIPHDPFWCHFEVQCIYCMLQLIFILLYTSLVSNLPLSYPLPSLSATSVSLPPVPTYSYPNSCPSHSYAFLPSTHLAHWNLFLDPTILQLIYPTHFYALLFCLLPFISTLLFQSCFSGDVPLFLRNVPNLSPKMQLS